MSGGKRLDRREHRSKATTLSSCGDDYASKSGAQLATRRQSSAGHIVATPTMDDRAVAQHRPRPADSGVRLAELMAALSIATDLGMGQPLESALCSCVVAIRLGEALQLDGDTLRDVYYLALLRYIGCNAETYALAALVGDELALRRDFAP